MPAGTQHYSGAVHVERLPYSVGRFGLGSIALILALLAIVALGISAYTRQFEAGEIVTGMRDIGTMGGAAWGLYIAFVVYFVGVSFAGITVAALIRLLNLTHLRPLSRMAELLTIISLILAGLSILADLGQPLRGIINLFQYARPQSPFFGTFSLVISGYLFASLVYFYLDGRRDAAHCARLPSRLRWFYRLWAAGYRGTAGEQARHHRASFYLAIGILPLLITAHSTLGFVFGLQVGRPGWFSALQAPGFVILAGISGIGLLIAIAAILRVVLDAREQLPLPVFSWLGTLLMLLTATYLYFLIVDWLTTTYQGQEHEARLTAAMLSGSFAWLYWLSVGSLLLAFLLLFGQFLTGRANLTLIVASGLVVNVAAIGKRYLIVVPSQIQGTLLPYPPGSYSPTQVEYGVILGLLALGVLLYTLFMKLFPIIEIPEPGHGG
ncbi:MAG: polysulfide reductase NrfD [Chloroflexi bacterium]|nr:polysulfide reductase NrfD [Chloroflexota bacterium]